MNWYINKKTNKLVQAIWEEDVNGKDYGCWFVYKDGRKIGYLKDADFQSQYGEAMVNNPMIPADDKPHIKDKFCDNLGCIPYIPRQKDEIVQIEKPKYCCIKCGWIGTEYILISKRKAGINRYESALSVEDGWTEPLIACPVCKNPVFEQGKYDVGNEPVFPICGTCNIQKEQDLTKGELKFYNTKPDSLMLSEMKAVEKAIELQKYSEDEGYVLMPADYYRAGMVAELDHLAKPEMELYKKVEVICKHYNKALDKKYDGLLVCDHCHKVCKEIKYIPLSDYIKGEGK
jgi:hypothetical protein